MPNARGSGSYTSLTGTGALNSGSITSGFGAIDTGASNITTTGTGSFGAVNVNGATLNSIIQEEATALAIALG